MRNWFTLLVLVPLIGLAACSDPTGAPNEAPPSVTLEANRLEGEATFSVTFQARATDPDGNTLSYSWSVNGEIVATHTGPVATIPFTEAGQYEVAVRVADGRHAASASLIVEARNEYRPTDAPDVVILGFAGRCNFLTCSAPAENRSYLSDVPDPGTLVAIAEAFRGLGFTTEAYGFRAHLYDGASGGYGYLTADAVLSFVQEEWIRDFRNPSRVVLVSHSHGSQFMSLLAGDHPDVRFAYGIYLDAVCSLWDADHIKSGLFDTYYDSSASYPAPLDRLTYACDSFDVPTVGLQDISDVVPWNVHWGLEVRGNAFSGSAPVADGDPNHRPDGTHGAEVGVVGVYQEDEGHNDVLVAGSAGLTWVIDGILRNGLPPSGLAMQAERRFNAPPAPPGFRFDQP